jgi:hypothetical protein
MMEEEDLAGSDQAERCDRSKAEQLQTIRIMLRHTLSIRSNSYLPSAYTVELQYKGAEGEKPGDT